MLDWKVYNNLFELQTVVQAEVPKKGTEPIKDKERQSTNTFASAEKLLRVCSVWVLVFYMVAER